MELYNLLDALKNFLHSKVFDKLAICPFTHLVAYLLPNDNVIYIFNPRTNARFTIVCAEIPRVRLNSDQKEIYNKAALPPSFSFSNNGAYFIWADDLTLYILPTNLLFNAKSNSSLVGLIQSKARKFDVSKVLTQVERQHLIIDDVLVDAAKHSGLNMRSTLYNIVCKLDSGQILVYHWRSTLKGWYWQKVFKEQPDVQYPKHLCIARKDYRKPELVFYARNKQLYHYDFKKCKCFPPFNIAEPVELAGNDSLFYIKNVRFLDVNLLIGILKESTNSLSVNLGGGKRFIFKLGDFNIKKIYDLFCINKEVYIVVGGVDKTNKVTVCIDVSKKLSNLVKKIHMDEMKRLESLLL